MITVTFTVVCSAQVIQQVWWPDAPATDVECRPGVLSLMTALDRARSAAATGDGEPEALDRFRRALYPEWRIRYSLHRRCSGDPAARGVLVAVDSLRYAEEHAVRYAARDLAARRLEVTRLSKRLTVHN